MIKRVWLKSGIQLDFAYAEPRDIKTIKGWNRFRRGESNPRKLDSIEFANSAIQKWKDLRAKKQVANSLKEIEVFVDDNPLAEVAALIVAKATPMPRIRLVGACLFRRSWANNLYLDYIVVHPFLVENPRKPLGGVGTALLYYVICLAAELKSSAVWGETTQNSVKFYRGLLPGKKIQDLLYLRKREYIRLKVGLKRSLFKGEN